MAIMHVDANSAYLSWTAAFLLEKGRSIDLRDIPSAIGGTQATRHGIILARSIPAKRKGIQTGETVTEALQKCPGLVIYPPNYDLYLLCSNAMVEILKEYSDQIQRYSIDECYLEWPGNDEEAIEVAHEIRQRIKRQLGFTVNVGVSHNKLLAKMASELEKPNRVHTLFPWEVEEKMWPLPLRELFMVGHATEQKLKRLGIHTIGDLARCDSRWLKAWLKSYGTMIWKYANGQDESPVLLQQDVVQKGVGNSMTISYDVVSEEDARAYLLSLTERVGLRLRRMGVRGSLVSLWLKTDTFACFRHQRQLQDYTDSTQEIYEILCQLFRECWQGQPLRQMGVGVGGFQRNFCRQVSFWDGKGREKEERLDCAMDQIRERYGEGSVMRARFADGARKPLEGGVNEGNYIMMGGYGR